jgi:hypothetical protein
MSEAKIDQFGSSDPQDAQLSEYRALSGLAVAGLTLGILGAAALIHPLLWVVPAGGIVASVAALKKIAREAPALIGRKAAFAGLVLSVLFGAGAPANWFTYRHLVDREAQRFAFQWFDFLRQGEMLKSYQLKAPPSSRRRLDDRLWDHYPPETEERRMLDSYTSRPEVRSLLALDGKARVRYYDTLSQQHAGEEDDVSQVYAVTTEEGGRKTSYFLRLSLKRIVLPGYGHAYWQVTGFDGGVHPYGSGEGAQSQQG